MFTLHRLIVFVIILPIIFVLPIQQSFAQIPPDSVFIPQQGDYAYADYPDVFDAFTNEGITIEIWFYLTKIPIRNDERWVLIYKPNNYYILLRGREPLGYSPDDPPKTIYVDSATISNNRGGGGANHTWLPKDKDYPLNQWTYVAWQIRGAESICEDALIVNGIGMGFGIFQGGSFSNTSDPIFIGGRPGYESLMGWIDEIRISKGQRYTIPVIFIPKKRFEADDKTLALWHFDEGPNATRYADSSGNRYTLIRVKAFSINQKQKLPITWGKLKK